MYKGKSGASKNKRTLVLFGNDGISIILLLWRKK